RLEQCRVANRQGAGEARVLGAQADVLRGQHEQRRGGRTLERRAHERFVDEGVGREGQMRAVLLDGRDRQQGYGRFGVDAAEVGRREVLPETATQRKEV